MKPVTLSRRNFLAASAAALFAPRLRAEAPSANALTDGNARFGYDLYAKLATEPGNLFLSPFSISAALAMTAAGAKGKTLDEMKKVLHLPPDAHTGFANLIGRVNGTGGKRAYQLTTANALFGQTGYPWRPEFADLTRKNYGAGLVDTDFKADAEGSRQRINGWVEKDTKEKIKNLIPMGVISALTRMVLTNAVHFKGNWANQFKKERTKDAQFHATGTKTAEVPMMNQEGRFRYAEAALNENTRVRTEVQVLELPYVGNELSMLVLLPRLNDLPFLERSLTAANVGGWADKLTPQLVDVSLPRFKMEWGTKSLVDPLKALGMKAAFGADADLTGMHSGSEHLFIAEVLHKAFVDVNEEGTEAAAATAVVVGRAGFAPPPKPKVFRADRPFLFLIRENATGSVLFLGRFAGPK